MSGRDIVTFLSDSGWGGGYVAVCEAMVTRIRPAARVCHISHEVPAGDIATGALTLERIAPLFPPAVHLAVVDPGVGTDRRPLALVAERGDALVGPDNGLLLPAALALGGVQSAWCLEPQLVRATAGLPVGQISSTFHGRDVFAPAAALLAATDDPSEFAVPVDPATVVRPPAASVEMLPDGVRAEVIEVDRFGNVGLAVRFAELDRRIERFLVEIVGEEVQAWTARVVRTYGELGSGELGVYCDSWGQTALALKSASAAQLLSLERGMHVRLVATPLPGTTGPDA